MNADRSQNCEKIDRNIPSIFQLSVLVRKYCYTSDTKQVPPQLKFKNLLLLLLLCGDVASNPGPTNFGFVNCRSIHNKGPLLQDLIKCSDLDILGLVETHIRPNDTDGLLSSHTSADYNFIQKPRCTGRGGGVGFLCRKTFSPSIVSSPVFRSFELSYFRSSLTTIALLLLVCTVLLVHVLLSFWKIFWLFLALCLQLVPVSSFVAI